MLIKKKRGGYIDIFKKRPSIDKYNEVFNDVPWIRENHICYISENMWVTFGGELFQDSMIQELSSFPFRDYAKN